MKPNLNHPRTQSQNLLGTFVEKILVGQIIPTVNMCYPYNVPQRRHFSSTLLQGDIPRIFLMHTADTNYR